MSARPLIGISACFFHPDSARATFAPKTLLYYEQSMPHWVLAHGGWPILIPTPTKDFRTENLVTELDGLLLHGGADLAPSSYSTEPLDEKRWPGDEVRDQYEIKLYNEFRKQNKPILGICRGAQLINVAHGGTLFQDIKTERPESLLHRDPDLYDKVYHNVLLQDDSLVKNIYNCENVVSTNSVHHQAIREMGQGLVVEAQCQADGIIEAIRHKDTKLNQPHSPFILGVQWHPEFMMSDNSEHLDPRPLMTQFLAEVKIRKV